MTTPCNHKAPIVFGQCSRCGLRFQKPFVDWDDLKQPTLEDQAVTIRALNRGQYDVFSAMLLNDERDADFIQDRILAEYRYSEMLGYTFDALSDPSWLLETDSIY